MNQECVMGGIELGIQTYPCFNTVYEVGRDLVKAGFNVILAANNPYFGSGRNWTSEHDSLLEDKLPRFSCAWNS